MPLSGALCIGGVPLTGVPGSADTWPNGVVGVSGSWSSSDSSAPLPKSDSSSNSSSSSPAPSTLPTMFTEMCPNSRGDVRRPTSANSSTSANSPPTHSV